MDVRPILLSFQTAIIAILFTFVLGTGVAYIVFRLKNRKLKILLNSLFTLPLVLPPTVFGFFLLTIFGVQQPVAQFLLDFFAIQVVFSLRSYGYCCRCCFISFNVSFSLNGV